MLESVIRNEVQRIVASLGLETYHPIDMGKTAQGRPDIYSMNPKGGSFVIEVKRIEPKVRVEATFMPHMISFGQRNWLDRWCYAKGGEGYLALGTQDHGKRRLWIIPWQKWVDFEIAFAKDLGIRMGERFAVPISKIEEVFSHSKIVGAYIEADYAYEFYWAGFEKGASRNWPNHGWTVPGLHPINSNVKLIHQPHRQSDWNGRSIRFDEDK